MSSGPISMSRRHVLGDFYSRCETIVSVPVYLGSVEGEMLGYVDQGLGHYADAFTFHLPDDVCKKLSAGYFTYSFDFDYSENEAAPGRHRRVKLVSISLIPRQDYKKPTPRGTVTATPNTEIEPAEASIQLSS